MERAKDRIYGPVERKVRVYGGKEFDRHGWMCFWLGAFVGFVVGCTAVMILILTLK